MTSAPSRMPRGTQPPPAANVIPFAKPRTIAALAASNPSNVVMRAATEATDTPFGDEGPTMVNSPAHVARMLATSARAPAAPAKPTAPPNGPTMMMTSPALKSAPPALPAASMGRGAPLAVQAAAQPITAWPAAAETVAIAPAAPAPATPAASEPAKTETPAQWAVYEKLGLGAPKINAAAAQKLIVSAYRMLGFVILSIIVVVLVGYIITTAFFYFSNTWIAPAAIAPTDEKVVALQSQLVEMQTARDRIADELNQAERSINAQQQFQLEFGKAIKSDLESRRATLGKIRALANAASSTRASIKSQNSAFASTSRKKMQQEYAAGLIDRNTMAQGNFQLAQITSSNLTLAERQAEFETRAAELESQTRSLDALVAANTGDEQTALSYEVLRIKQEYEASRLDLAKAVETRDTLKAALERQDKIVASLKQSAYLRAVNDGVHIAYVPYGNLTEAQKGEKLYACKVGMVLCYKVGEVVDVLPGEVQFKHPHRDKIMRGQLVELKMDEEDADAAAEDVLFVGGKPLVF